MSATFRLLPLSTTGLALAQRGTLITWCTGMDNRGVTVDGGILIKVDNVRLHVKFIKETLKLIGSVIVTI